jgi:hypothetical protein
MHFTFNSYHLHSTFIIHQLSHDNFTIQIKSLPYHFIILKHVTKSYKPISLHSYHKTKLNRLTWHFRGKNKSRRYRTLSPGPPGARNVLQTAKQQGPVTRAPILSPGRCDWVQNCQITGLCHPSAHPGAWAPVTDAKLCVFCVPAPGGLRTGVVYYFDYDMSCRPSNWVTSVANE